MSVRDGVKSVVASMFKGKMPAYWYEGNADTDDLAEYLQEIGE